MRSRLWLPVDWLAAWLMVRIFRYWRMRTGKPPLVVWLRSSDDGEAALAEWQPSGPPN